MTGDFIGLSPNNDDILRTMGRQTPKGEQPGEAYFNQVTVERFTSDVSMAIGHSNSRNDRVAQVASFFSLIRNASPSVAAAAVRIEKPTRTCFCSLAGIRLRTICQVSSKSKCTQLKIERDLPWFLLPTAMARDRLRHLSPMWSICR